MLQGCTLAKGTLYGLSLFFSSDSSHLMYKARPSLLLGSSEPSLSQDSNTYFDGTLLGGCSALKRPHPRPLRQYVWPAKSLSLWVPATADRKLPWSWVVTTGHQGPTRVMWDEGQTETFCHHSISLHLPTTIEAAQMTCH